MRILTIVDKLESAIGILAFQNQKENKHLINDVIAVHPKRPDAEQLNAFFELAPKADLIEWGYWRTAEMLKKEHPDYVKGKPQLLQHNNPYDLTSQSWRDYDLIVVNNEEQKRILEEHDRFLKVQLVPLGTDLEFFKFKDDYIDKPIINMVVARIDANKGVLPVAKACNELGYRFLLIGRISDREYFMEIMRANPNTEFYENVTNEELRNFYYTSALHICNSKDGFESGTLPILEAMACGVPVLTRRVGHVPDLFNEKNLFINYGEYDDVESLKIRLKEIIDDREKRLEVRNEAWNTVKNRNYKNRARIFSGLYYSLLRPENDLVSIVVPTFNRFKVLADCLKHLALSDYPNLEIVVADDGSTDETKSFVGQLRKKIKIPLKYVNTGLTDCYGLAPARNLGAIEAEGKLVGFLDDRYKIKKDAISKMVERFKTEVRSFPKVIIYGKKSSKTNFIENFFLMDRRQFMNVGFFERVNKYGGMTQATSVRFNRLEFRFIQEPQAEAEEICGSKAKYRKRDEIIEMKHLLFKAGLYD